MAYTNSSLVSYTKLSPNHSGQRTHSIDRITPHCVVGQCSVETLGNIFLPTSRQASCNYGIGVDGRVGMYVEEKNRSWCSSSSANDQRAVTIECASDTTEPYAFKDVVYQTLIKLCVDICKRNGKKKLLWLGDKDKTLSYEPKSDEMVLTVHRWFANKSCPGSWMYARMGDLAAKVTAQLGGGASEGTETEYPEKLTEGYYRVRKTWADAKSQKGAYKILSNAKKCADANPGYSVFDNNGVNIYTPAGRLCGGGRSAVYRQGQHLRPEHPQGAGDGLRQDRNFYRERRIHHHGGAVRAGFHGWLGTLEVRRRVDISGLCSENRIRK